MPSIIKITISDTARAPEPPEEVVASLPIEVWQRIASYMPRLKDWTKTGASTCKALRKMQLVAVNLDGIPSESKFSRQAFHAPYGVKCPNKALHIKLRQYEVLQVMLMITGNLPCLLC